MIVPALTLSGVAKPVVPEPNFSLASINRLRLKAGHARGGPLALDLVPELAREHPPKAREKVGAVEGRVVAGELLAPIIVPRRHAKERRVRAQKWQRCSKVVKEIRCNVQII